MGMKQWWKDNLWGKVKLADKRASSTSFTQRGPHMESLVPRVRVEKSVSDRVRYCVVSKIIYNYAFINLL
jgi:hypothetical protein